MSARQPFMPTRAATPSSAMESHDDLPAPPSAQPPKESSQQLQLQKTQNDFGNKPLNLNGLFAPKNRAVQALQNRHSKTLEGRPQSPATLYQQNLQIRSPKPSAPFYMNGGASASGMLTVTTFDHGEHVASLDQTISNSRGATSLNRKGSAVSPPRSSSLLYPTSDLKNRISHSNSLEKIKEAVEEDEERGSLADEHEGGDRFSENSSHRREQFQQRFSSNEAQDDGSRMLRRTSKKRQPMSDDEEEYGYPTPSKRFKSDEQDQAGCDDRLSRRSSPVAHRIAERQPVNTDQTPIVLQRLFGDDITTRVTEHMEQYETAQKKWSDCSADEWNAGAQELSLKFSSLLDVVKDRMTSKLSLYAGFDTTLAEHKKVLDERDKDLDGVRQALLKNSGSVVG